MLISWLVQIKSFYKVTFLALTLWGEPWGKPWGKIVATVFKDIGTK